MLDIFYGFFTPGEKARKVVGGIGDEVVARPREYGSVLERPNTYGAGITYGAEHLKATPGRSPPRRSRGLYWRKPTLEWPVHDQSVPPWVLCDCANFVRPLLRFLDD